MGSKPRVDAAEQDLFRMEQVNLIDPWHETAKLAASIERPAFAETWGPRFVFTIARLALGTRLMASRLDLTHTPALSHAQDAGR